jgi:hypothetical protein
MSKLVILRRDGKRGASLILEDKCVFGSGPTCVMHILDAELEHAYLFKHDGVFCLGNLSRRRASVTLTRGACVNKVECMQLQPGDVITVAGRSFVFE